MNRAQTVVSTILIVFILLGCQTMFKDNYRFGSDAGSTDVDIDSNDECCAYGDPCALANNGACNCNGDFADDWDRDDCLPGSVRIEFIGAVIAPCGHDKTLWDITGEVPVDVWKAFKDLDPATATADSILAFMNGTAVQSLSKPDPHGRAEIDRGSGYSDPLVLADIDSNIEDTFFPTWPLPYPYYDNVVLGEDLKIRVTIVEEDLAFDDPIGVAKIGYTELVQAYLSGDIYYVNVAGQTMEQLLLISIEVY